MDYLEKIIASIIASLTVYNLWLTAQKKRLELKRLRQEERRKRRGG